MRCGPFIEAVSHKTMTALGDQTRQQLMLLMMSEPCL